MTGRCIKIFVHICASLVSLDVRIVMCQRSISPPYICVVNTLNKTHNIIWASQSGRNAFCKKNPPTKAHAPAPPRNFTIKTIPHAIDIHNKRSVVLQWKFPKSGTGTVVTDFMLKSNNCGGSQCVIFNMLNKQVTEDLVKEGTIMCTQDVCDSQHAQHHMTADLYSIPLSKELAHTTVNYTIVYSPDVTIKESCNGEMDVSFDDYGYQKYRITVENGWFEDATRAYRVIILNNTNTHYTFTNITHGKYRVVVLPAGCTKCKRWPQYIEIGNITCERTEESITSANTTTMESSAESRISGNVIAAITVPVVTVLLAVGTVLFVVKRRGYSQRSCEDNTKDQIHMDVLMKLGVCEKNPTDKADSVIDISEDSRRKLKKKVLIISIWDNSEIIRNFAEFLEKSCSCHVFLSAHKDRDYLLNPKTWLDSCLSEVDYVIIVNSKLAFDLRNGKWKKDHSTTIDFSDDVFLLALDKIHQAESDDYSKYVMVRFPDTPLEFVLSNEIPGCVYELPSKLTDFICRIHSIQMRGLDTSVIDNVYKSKSIEEWRWMSYLATKTIGEDRDLSLDHYNTPEVKDWTDESTVITDLVAPAKTEDISVSEEVMHDLRFSDTFNDGHFDSGYMTFAPVVTDEATVMSDFVSPAPTEAITVPDDALWSGSDFSHIAVGDFSVLTRDQGGLNMVDTANNRQSYLNAFPSLESYTSAESMSFSHHPSDGEEFVAPEAESKFQGTDKEIRLMNLESDWLQHVWPK